jgi:hypothetical protein
LNGRIGFAREFIHGFNLWLNIMTDWQQRIEDEKSQLDVKVSKLKLFIYGKSFEGLDAIDKALLKDQCNTMVKYSNILADRIARFHT